MHIKAINTHKKAKNGIGEHIYSFRVAVCENIFTPLELLFVSFPSDTELSIQIKFNSLIQICEYEYKNWTTVGMWVVVQRPLP